MPVVFLQCFDECNALDQDAKARLLTVANIHNTGHMHGFMLARRGMRVRLTAKQNASVGLVQEQTATIVDFLFHDKDAELTDKLLRVLCSDLNVCLLPLS